jgi:peptidylprolyl isomerase
MRAARHRLLVAATSAFAALVLAACGSSGSGKGANVNAGSNPFTRVESAQGKPCVAPSEPMPAGAPAVPVVVGPPPTQLVITDLVPGTGATATASTTATLSLDYTAVMCSNGKLLDSSYKSGQPFTTTLGQVVPGWRQGIPGMKVGGTRLLGIPPALAYGASGDPPTIAPDETLWFVIQLHGITG